MKQIFRHLMGEYNGEILKALCYYHNVAMDDLIDLFYYWATVQWVVPGKETSEASAIRRADAVGIAHTAGFFSPIVRSTYMSGSVRFAGDNDNGTDSEQSVQAFIDGAIRYITNEQLQNNDISIFAKGFTKSSSSSGGNTLHTFTGDKDTTQVVMVPPGVEPVGYLVPAEVITGTGDTLDLDATDADHMTGQVMLVDEEPSSGFYLPYYGPEYAWLDKAVLIQILLEEHQELFMQLLECLQHIRYNGSSMTDFLQITGILLGNYLKIVSVEPMLSTSKPHVFEVRFTTFDDDDTVPVTERQMRYTCWEYFIAKKFPQFWLDTVEVPHLDCLLTFENNEWSLECTVQPTAAIYYTTDGSDPKISGELYDGEEHYISESVHLRAYAQGGDFSGTYYASSNTVDEMLVPSHLYYDGTTTYNGDNTYRG